MHLNVALPRDAVGLPHTAGLRVGELTSSSSCDPQLEFSVETVHVNKLHTENFTSPETHDSRK